MALKAVYEKKKEARVMYAKRLLYKDIKQLLNKKVIKYKEIIGRKLKRQDKKRINFTIHV